MFCRGRQWVTETELDADLPALLGNTDRPTGLVSLRARLSAAEIQLGRFFFVHQAQATRDNTRLRTYEFMHATFSEYLIARLVTRELGDLADAAQFAASRSRAIPPDDAFLYALLSFSPLTTRGTIVSFVAERFGRYSKRNVTGSAQCCWNCSVRLWAPGTIQGMQTLALSAPRSSEIRRILSEPGSSRRFRKRRGDRQRPVPNSPRPGGGLASAHAPVALTTPGRRLGRPDPHDHGPADLGWRPAGHTPCAHRSRATASALGSVLDL